MSKITKLLRSPRAFFGDALDKCWPELKLAGAIKAAKASGKSTAVLIGFSDWKTWMRDVLDDQHVVFLGHSSRVAPALLNAIPSFPKPTVYAWSYKFPEALRAICARNNIPLVFVEDGFMRGVGLGVDKTRPMSLAFDDKAMHFDRSSLSTLDGILNATGALPDAALEDADVVMEAIRTGMTKYMSRSKRNGLSETLNLEPNRRTLVVLGQVEDDLSIAYGMEGFMSGNDLVARVALENPNTQIIYRPHPESIAVTKKHYSNPQDVAHIAHVVGPEWSLHETLSCAQEAHAITSLAGLEAAVMGLEVHTYGTSFYAGWGFTTDHGRPGVAEKRTRTRSLREVVAAAYVLYPRYFHPITSKAIAPREAFALVRSIQTEMACMTETGARRFACSEQERGLLVAENGLDAETLPDSIRIIHERT